ncbi:MAG: sulfotransferase [Xenococcaceae cyanobacterium MO_207.B15]|nr:sulfotransferase [Xenococcaceae cyanobacterium MO_207.B15]
MTMPNFLIIGAAKAGTTALYHYLQQHPQIYMSPHKEPRFFALEGESINFQGPGDKTRFRFVTEMESYRALFEGVSQEIAIGEASPWYLYVPQAGERIKKHLPDVKLIVILREPVARAYSNFIHALREGLEPLEDFAQAMEAESERIRQNWSYRWHYKQKGFYYGQIKHYFDLFDREQIKVYLYDDFINNPISLLQDIFRFLGVDDSFIPDLSSKHNVSGIPKNYVLDQFLIRDTRLKRVLTRLVRSKTLREQLEKKLMELNLRQKPPLKPEVRERFKQEYREDILKLQELIQKDLSKWLVVSG